MSGRPEKKKIQNNNRTIKIPIAPPPLPPPNPYIMNGPLIQCWVPVFSTKMKDYLQEE